MILNSKSSQVPHIDTNLPPSLKFQSVSTPAVLELQAILRQVQRMTQKDLKH